MAKFSYTAIGANGAAVTGIETAPNHGALSLSLRERGLQPVKVKERKSVFQFEITRKKVKRKELMHFSRQLAVFVKAGIPILDALEIIASETGDKLFKKALTSMIS